MRAMENAARSLSLSISLVLYNSDLALVERTITRLERAVARAREQGVLGAAGLAVVDNASPGDYGERVRQLLAARRDDWPALAAEYRRAASNRGYGAGHNLALTAAGSDLHLVLNPDVELEEDALAVALAHMAAEPDVALLAPAARGSSGEVEHLCKRYPSLLVLLLRACGRPRLFRRCLARYEMRELENSRAPVEVPLISGCWMLARTGVLAAEGGFDEAYFLYFEDFDLSLRLARRGRVVYHPGVRIVHHGGYASRKGWRHVLLFARGGLRFFRQYGWRWL